MSNEPPPPSTADVAILALLEMHDNTMGGRCSECSCSKHGCVVNYPCRTVRAIRRITGVTE